MKRTSLLSFIFLYTFVCNSSFATDFTFDGIGLFSDESLWSPTYPGTFISSEHSITISSESICTIPVGTLVNNQGSFTNDGEIIAENTFGNGIGGFMINNGLLHCLSTFENFGELINNGSIIAESTFSSQGFSNLTNASTGTIVNNTSFVATTINGNNNWFLGAFHGEGDIFVEDYPNEGVISPGFSPGILNFKSGLNLQNPGSLKIEIAGTAGPGNPLGHDQINVTGDLNLGGNLEVIVLNEFEPNGSEKWTIAKGSISGDFNSVTLPTSSEFFYALDYQSDSLVIELYSIVLPVIMHDFKASKRENMTQLNWTTSSEINNKGWFIERSQNAIDWQQLHFVNGANSSNSLLSYSYLDNRPNPGINYYRLQQIDLDGEKSHSNVVELTHDIPVEISIYPNPSIEKIYISDIITDAELYSSTGKLMKKYKQAIQEIDLDNLSNGIYFLLIKHQGITTKRKIYVK